MKISRKLRIYELETLEIIPRDFRKKVSIPITYIPMPRKDHNTTRYWSWRAFMGERFIGEFTPWWSRRMKPPIDYQYKRRPTLSTALGDGTLSTYSVGVDEKKIARTLNVLEFGSTRYGPTRLIKCIKAHCGIDARDISHSNRR